MPKGGVVHRTGVTGIEHLSYVDGGYYECWCVGKCCQDMDGSGNILCVCPECCCGDEEYQAIWFREHFND